MEVKSKGVIDLAAMIKTNSPSQSAEGKGNQQFRALFNTALKSIATPAATTRDTPSPEMFFTLNEKQGKSGDVVSDADSLSIMTLGATAADLAADTRPWLDGYYGRISRDQNPQLMEVLKNKFSSIETGRAEYATYLDKAQKAVNALEKLNSQGVLDIRLNGAGVAQVEINDIRYYKMLSQYQVQTNRDAAKEKINQDFKAVLGAIDEKQAEYIDMASKNYTYTMGKSVAAYAQKTGITYDTLDNGDDVIEYLHRIKAYANEAFGTSPKSYAVVEQERSFIKEVMYVDGTGADGTLVKNRLPNM